MTDTPMPVAECAGEVKDSWSTVLPGGLATGWRERSHLVLFSPEAAGPDMDLKTRLVSR